jgi:peptide/nickel transport system permease protein
MSQVRAVWRWWPLVLLLAWVIVILFPGLVAHRSPLNLNLDSTLAPPSSRHWFGTDEDGRDLFARCIYGVKDSVGTSIVIVFAAAAIGLVLGGLAGMGNRLMDAVVMRTTDAFLAFPYLILAIALAAALGSGLTTVMIALLAVWWPSYARAVRGQVLVLRELPFIEGAHAIGTPRRWIFVRHMLPHLVSQLAARVSVDVGYAILALTGLSFLGLGAQPPTPELGAIIADARNYALQSWWYATLPGIFILLAVLSSMAIGNRLERITRTSSP